MARATLKWAERIFREAGGILRTGEALALGIHPRVLYQMRDAGLLQPMSRGVYRLASTQPIEEPDLTTVALRIPRGVIALISALAYHELTSEVPHQVWVALPRGTKTPRLDYPPLRIVRFSTKTFSAGIEVARIGRAKVQIYSVAKTIADCFRFRNQIGIDVVVQALRIALKKKRTKSSEILRYAKLWRVDKTMRPYLEAML